MLTWQMEKTGMKVTRHQGVLGVVGDTSNIGVCRVLLRPICTRDSCRPAFLLSLVCWALLSIAVAGCGISRSTGLSKLRDCSSCYGAPARRLAFYYVLCLLVSVCSAAASLFTSLIADSLSVLQLVQYNHRHHCEVRVRAG